MQNFLENILKMIRESVNNEPTSENGELIGMGVVLIYSKGRNLQPKEYLVTEGDISHEQIIAAATSAKKNSLLPKATQKLPPSYLDQITTRPRM